MAVYDGVPPRAEVVVDLAAVRHNVALLAGRAARSGARTMAVVKADGYGHGALQVARAALESGADWLGVCHLEEALALREAGIQRVHHNVETAESYYDEVSTTVRYAARLRTIDAVREAGLETCVGGILNLGESREQRVEMAFELAKIDPTSVPINLLNPRPGTKFGDREYMDPVEAVKWIAIFRLILPDALFRLCGGRNENIGELQTLAVQRVDRQQVQRRRVADHSDAVARRQRLVRQQLGRVEHLGDVLHPDHAGLLEQGLDAGLVARTDADCRT